MIAGERVAVVSDRNTHAALGQRVEAALASAFTVQSVIIPAPHADAATVAQLDAAVAPDTHAIIAVGSGTNQEKLLVDWSAENVAAIDEGLAFSPWHGLAAHRPLGGIMRARNSTYTSSASFRASRNGCPIHEPKA